MYIDPHTHTSKQAVHHLQSQTMLLHSLIEYAAQLSLSDCRPSYRRTTLTQYQHSWLGKIKWPPTFPNEGNFRLMIAAVVDDAFTPPFP